MSITGAIESSQDVFSVPGKRKKRSVSTRHSQKTFRRGRPMKRISEKTVPRTLVNARLRELYKQDHFEMLETSSLPCLLEQLPNELIQQVFFHCFEVNLPRASSRLAAALSTESVYNALVVFAYFDDDGHTPVETKYFSPATYRYLPAKDKLELQRKIMGCRWYTLDRLKSCLPALSHLQMTQAWHREKEHEESILDVPITHADPRLVVADTGLKPLAPLPVFDDHNGKVRHFFARSEYRPTTSKTSWAAEEIVEYETYLPRIITWRSTLGSNDATSEVIQYKAKHAKFSTLAARVLPKWLLNGGPWTQEKIELLQLLRQGFEFIRTDSILDISATAVVEGISSAIQEENITALLTLLELHNSIFEKPSTYDESLLAAPNHHPLPSQLFRLATEAETKSSDIMWLLIRAGVDSIPRDDTLLTAWALQGQAEGDPVASWLLNHMTGTAEYHIGRRGYLFVNGALSWRVADADFPQSAHRFPQELGYLERGRTLISTNPDGGPCGS